MGFAALITWFAAVMAGLYMFTVWLIENDVTGRHAAPSPSGSAALTSVSCASAGECSAGGTVGVGAFVISET